MRGAVRDLLLGNAGLFVGRTSLAEAAGPRAGALEAAIAELSAEGCVIDRDASGGARLGSSPELLRPAEVAASLEDTRMRFEIDHRLELDSTNDAAWDRAGAGAAEGAVVSADSQKSGRGRGGNRWESSPFRGLWFSVVLKALPPAGSSARTTCAAAVAVAESLGAAAGVKAMIKWPNDVWIGMRKICGILTETRSRGDMPSPVVLGIGMNVNHAPEDFPPGIRGRATSLRIEKGRTFDRTAVMSAVLRSLDYWYGRASDGPAEELDGRYSELSMLHGMDVRFDFGREKVEGKVTGISCALGMTLAMAGGRTRTFRAEHISSVELRGR